MYRALPDVMRNGASKLAIDFHGEASNSVVGSDGRGVDKCSRANGCSISSTGAGRSSR